MLFYFPMVFSVGMATFRNWPLAQRIGWSAVATIAATVLSAVLIVFMGVPFHFAIGGRL